MTYLTILHRRQLGIERSANNFRIRVVVRLPFPSRYPIPVQAFLVADSIILPRFVVLPIQRALQDPVPWSRGIGGLYYHVDHLVHLKFRFVKAVSSILSRTTCRSGVLVHRQLQYVTSRSTGDARLDNLDGKMLRIMAWAEMESPNEFS